MLIFVETVLRRKCDIKEELIHSSIVSTQYVMLMTCYLASALMC